jgi:hypothetical protein
MRSRAAAAHVGNLDIWRNCGHNLIKDDGNEDSFWEAGSAYAPDDTGYIGHIGKTGSKDGSNLGIPSLKEARGGEDGVWKIRAVNVVGESWGGGSRYRKGKT